MSALGRILNIGVLGSGRPLFFARIWSAVSSGSRARKRASVATKVQGISRGAFWSTVSHGKGRRFDPRIAPPGPGYRSPGDRPIHSRWPAMPSVTNGPCWMNSSHFMKEEVQLLRCRIALESSKASRRRGECLWAAGTPIGSG